MKHLATALSTLIFCAAASAQVTITDPWVRGTVPQQKASGLFMQIDAAQDVRLIGGSSRDRQGPHHGAQARRLPRDADGAEAAAQGRRHRASPRWAAARPRPCSTTGTDYTTTRTIP